MTTDADAPAAAGDRGRFAVRLEGAGLYPLTAVAVTTLQVNVGKVCNQACHHCHVDAGPHRTEAMDRETADLCLTALERHPEIRTLDITGGAPELNPNFRHLVAGARALGRAVIDRCNLTILSEPGQEDLAAFLAAHRVEVTASLPYFTGERTDAQRGRGVFARSIEGLRTLNGLGYGDPESGLVLNLVYNPTGAFLPPDQGAAEAQFRRELSRRHGVVFTNLFTMTNLPIARFRHFLERTGNYDRYLDRLEAAFNPAAATSVMCRSLVSVGYDGSLYDCDFNQMLGWEVGGGGGGPHGRGGPRHIRDFDAHLLARRRIAVGDHCLACAAGAGSSCGGAVT